MFTAHQYTLFRQPYPSTVYFLSQRHCPQPSIAIAIVQYMSLQCLNEMVVTCNHHHFPGLQRLNAFNDFANRMFINAIRFHIHFILQQIFKSRKCRSKNEIPSAVIFIQGFINDDLNFQKSETSPAVIKTAFETITTRSKLSNSDIT